MNGHSGAELLAFKMSEISRRYNGSIGDPDDSPVFVFAVHRHSGESELTQRLGLPFANDAAIDGTMLWALAHQMARIASIAPGAGSDSVAGACSHDAPASRIADLVRAQGRFIREASQTQAGGHACRRWGLSLAGLSAEHALYLRVLFPNAKFLFLHRDPVETFQCSVMPTWAREGPSTSSDELLDRFAQQWCQIIATFELWHKDVGGLLIGYQRIIAPEPREIEEYLSERLHAPCPRGRTSATPLGRELDCDEVAFIMERAGAVARRYGYRSTATPALSRAREGMQQFVPPVGPVHLEGRKLTCAVLVPTIRYIEPECEEALAQLERRGYAVKRVRGCTAIDRARSMLATAALDDGFDETLWVDADIAFHPDAVEGLRSWGLPIVTGIYARKEARRGLALAPVPGTHELVLGGDDGLLEVLYAGMGFLHVRREVYQAIQERFGLPLCDRDTARRAIPFFMPMLEDWGGELSYLAEDYAFCRRARLSGYKIMADTSIRLWHIGTYRYGYEDAGNEVPRSPTYRHVFELERGSDGK